MRPQEKKAAIWVFGPEYVLPMWARSCTMVENGCIRTPDEGSIQWAHSLDESLGLRAQCLRVGFGLVAQELESRCRLKFKLRMPSK